MCLTYGPSQYSISSVTENKCALSSSSEREGWIDIRHDFFRFRLTCTLLSAPALSSTSARSIMLVCPCNGERVINCNHHRHHGNLRPVPEQKKRPHSLTGLKDLHKVPTVQRGLGLSRFSEPHRTSFHLCAIDNNSLHERVPLTESRGKVALGWLP